MYENMIQESANNLFFGLKSNAPWPSNYPSGRLIQMDELHATLAFLGKADLEKLIPLLKTFPSFNFPSGLAAIFDQLLFLPKNQPNVVAWHVDFFENAIRLEKCQKELITWLKNEGFDTDDTHQNWLPHVTVARKPFSNDEWEASFQKLPVVFDSIHLYESIGNLRYRSLWSMPLTMPWTEIEHTADIAFNLKGENLEQLYRHAGLSLSFKFPELLDFLPKKVPSDLDDLIMLLNEAVCLADGTIGCPFKAVSFHGDLKKNDQILQWEMIVDV